MLKKSLGKGLGLVLAFFLFYLPCFAQQQQSQSEEISITTYYPSPYGTYKELQLYPNTSPNTCDANNEGKVKDAVGKVKDAVDKKLKTVHSSS